MKYEVFVYATLKKGFPNFKLNQGKKLPGRFTTESSYPLYLVGDRHSPWMIDDAGNGEIINGEVYQVDKQQLKKMDKLESINKEDGYRRILIQVKSLKHFHVHDVFCYMKPKDMLNIENIRFGPLSSYEQEHSKLYKPRSEK